MLNIESYKINNPREVLDTDRPTILEVSQISNTNSAMETSTLQPSRLEIVIDQVLNKISKIFDARNSTTLLPKLFNIRCFNNMDAYSLMYKNADEVIGISRELDFVNRIQFINMNKSGNCGEKALIAGLLFMEEGFTENLKFMTTDDDSHDYLILTEGEEIWLVDPWVLRYFRMSSRNFEAFFSCSGKAIESDSATIKQVITESMESNIVARFLKNNRPTIPTFSQEQQPSVATLRAKD